MAHVTDGNHLNRRKELAFFDENSARALVNLLPERLCSELRLVWNGELGGLFGLNEPALMAEMRRAGHPPAPIDQILRHRFWYEFNRAQDDDWRHPKIDMAFVLGRDIPKEVFFSKYITNPYKLALLFCPPVDYQTAVKAALTASLAQVMAAVDKLKLFDPNTGDVKAAAYDKMLKTYEILHAKVNGVAGPAAGHRRAKARAEEPEPSLVGPTLSVEEQLAELKLKNAELERIRGADLKKETGTL